MRLDKDTVAYFKAMAEETGIPATALRSLQPIRETHSQPSYFHSRNTKAAGMTSTLPRLPMSTTDATFCGSWPNCSASM